MKQFQVITLDVLLPPDEINEIYADINDDLQINVNIYGLIMDIYGLIMDIYGLYV